MSVAHVEDRCVVCCQAEDGIRELVRSRGLGDVYKRQVHPGRQALADAAAARLVVAIVDAQCARGVAQISMTGGSMGSQIISSLCAVPARDAVDWSQVHVWWGDERWLPAGDPDRNDTQNDQAGLATLGLTPEHVHRVAGPDTSETVSYTHLTLPASDPV